LAEAVKLYGEILQAYPNDSAALHMRGFLAHQQMQYLLAEDLFFQAIFHDPRNAAFHNSLGNTYKAQGQLNEAMASYRRGLALNPSSPELHNNVGNVLAAMGAAGEAIAHYQQSLVLNPAYIEAYNNLGRAYEAVGNNDDAVIAYRKAIKLKPNMPELHMNLGNAFKGLGKYSEAAVSYQLAVKCRPHFPEAHCSLGNVLKLIDQVDEAVSCLSRALELKPDLVEAWNSLALAYRQTGRSREALAAVLRSLQIRETLEAKVIFVECVKGDDRPADEAIIKYLVRAMTEFWGLASELCGPATAVLWDDRTIGTYLSQFSPTANQTPTDVLGDEGFRLLSAHPITNALLLTGPVCDPALERVLTVARSNLLDRVGAAMPAGDEHLSLACTLAQQCYVNDYVFSITEEEQKRVSDLRELVSSHQAHAVRPISLATLAAYVPLSSLAQSESLSREKWTSPLASVITQQLLEPGEEALALQDIPRQTRINNAVSVSVKQQYEESPYPKWIGVARRGQPKSIARYFAEKFGFRVASKKHANMLVAGCGTGRHAIEAAWAFRDTEVMAFDLSSRSLAYALRKTRELGLSNLRYCQADILDLDGVEQFDIIECVGVLHHLEFPWKGFRALLDHLEPGGLMKVGLYSRVARQRIAEVRKHEGTQGVSEQDIRQIRQELIGSVEAAALKGILDSHDFYNLSSCRDLLFHVQEHVLTLDEIQSALDDMNLTFIGFEIDEPVLASYRAQFPKDPDCRNLAQWKLFEQKNPDTFRNMYQFWLQKS
jgi:tetratricopeptide (TPR) repeat protein/SAM-dependent methyltransferase